MLYSGLYNDQRFFSGCIKWCILHMYQSRSTNVGWPTSCLVYKFVLKIVVYQIQLKILEPLHQSNEQLQSVQVHEKILKKMKWYDIPLLKLTVFFFTLFLVTVWPQFNKLVMSIAWYWYLAVGVILYLVMMKHTCTGVCKKKTRKKKK